MVQPINLTQFLKDFQSYLASRGIDPDFIGYMNEGYTTVEINPAFNSVINQMQAVAITNQVDSQLLAEHFEMANDNLYSYLLYTYLQAIFQGDINKAEQYWSVAESRLEQLDEITRIKFYQLRFALAFDPKTKKFNTDTLLHNQIKLIQEYPHYVNRTLVYFCLKVWPFFIEASCNQEKQTHYDYSDYFVENAINFITIILSELKKMFGIHVSNPKFNCDPTIFPQLPLPLVFSHPQQNDATFKFGLHLLDIGVEPGYILGCSKQNITDDYRLLNHCVELLADKFKNELFENGENNENSNLSIFYAQHPYIPAAKFYSRKNNEMIAAARLNYKPAIARCLTLGKTADYGAAQQTRFEHTLLLWQENYLSTAETLRIIMRVDIAPHKPGDFQSPKNDHTTVKILPASAVTSVCGLTFSAPSDADCFEQRMLILTAVCAAHPLLIHVRFEKKTINLDHFIAILLHLCDLSPTSQRRLQKWVDTVFGQLLIMEYFYKCFNLASPDQINHRARIILKSLLCCNPHYLTLWQKELLCNQLSTVLSFTEAMHTAYKAVKTIQQDNINEVSTAIKQNTLFTINNTLLAILNNFSLSYLLSSQLRAVSKRFKSIIDWILLNILRQGLQYTGRIISLRYLERILFLSFVSDSVILRKTGVDYLYKLQQIYHSTLSILPFDTGLDMKPYIQKGKNAAVAAGNLEVIQALIPCFSDSLAYFIWEAKKHNNISVIAFLLRKKSESPLSVGVMPQFNLTDMYVNALLSGDMSQARHTDYLFIIRDQLSDSVPTAADVIFHNAILCQDWSLLILLWRLDPEHFSNLLNKEKSNSSVAEVKSFMHVQNCSVTASAPSWWQEQQRRCFDYLKIEKAQLINLCQQLVIRFINIPTQTGPGMISASGNCARQTLNILAKNNFLQSVQNLCSSLSNHTIDAIKGTQQLLQLVHRFRDTLVNNNNRGFLLLIDQFFDLPKVCTINMLKQCIYNCLKRANCVVPSSTSNSDTILINNAASKTSQSRER